MDNSGVTLAPQQRGPTDVLQAPLKLLCACVKTDVRGVEHGNTRIHAHMGRQLRVCCESVRTRVQ